MKGSRPGAVRHAEDRTASVVTLGGVAALLVAVCVAIAALQARRVQSAYDVANPCPMGAVWESDCIDYVSATVIGVKNTDGKHPVHRLNISTPDGNHPVGFPRTNALPESAVDQTPVVLTVWRGRVTEVSTSWSGAVATSESPATHYEKDLDVALLVLGWAAFLLLAGTWTLWSDRRLRSTGKRRGRQRMHPAAVGKPPNFIGLEDPWAAARIVDRARTAARARTPVPGWKHP
jgi:hypothetical protein